MLQKSAVFCKLHNAERCCFNSGIKAVKLYLRNVWKSFRMQSKFLLLLFMQMYFDKLRIKRDTEFNDNEKNGTPIRIFRDFHMKTSNNSHVFPFTFTKFFKNFLSFNSEVSQAFTISRKFAFHVKSLAKFEDIWGENEKNQYK